MHAFESLPEEIPHKPESKDKGKLATGRAFITQIANAEVTEPGLHPAWKWLGKDLGRQIDLQVRIRNKLVVKSDEGKLVRVGLQLLLVVTLPNGESLRFLQESAAESVPTA